ncbi:hypothetical protein HYU72_01525 [Candidatus Berkelbacteria bacterium]|nr:hypothetical protein [Candidatus Berkelbacteria bacterium]
MNKTLFLIDGHALLHRAYHALPPLTSPQNEPVGAVYGFASVLLKILSEFKPDYLAVAFDLKGPTFRHLEFKEYKIHRPKTPADLIAQQTTVEQVIRAFDFPIYSQSSFEAEDVIASLVKQTPADLQVTIITGDQDLLQLTDAKTAVFLMRRGLSDFDNFSPQKLKETYGLTPKQWVDFRALTGDASDNIPGVAGIGPKTALELISRFGALEEVYKNIKKLPEKTRQRLLENKEAAFLSQKIATIRRDVPIKLDLEKARVNHYNNVRVRAIFQELGFYSLLKRLEKPSLF